MYHEKQGVAKCGHTTSYLTKDNASFEPERCNACLHEYFAERKRKYAAGYREPTIPEDERMAMAECGHLGEAIMVDGRRVEPTECLECFIARHEQNGPVDPEAIEAVEILGKLMHDFFSEAKNNE